MASYTTFLIALLITLTFSMTAREVMLNAVYFFLDNPPALAFGIILLCVFAPVNDGHICIHTDESSRLVPCYPDPEYKYVGRLCPTAARRQQVKRIRLWLEPTMRLCGEVVRILVSRARSCIVWLYDSVCKCAPIFISAAVSLIRLALGSPKARRVVLKATAIVLLGNFFIHHALLHEILIALVAAGAGWVYREQLWECVMASSPVTSYLKCCREEQESSETRYTRRRVRRSRAKKVQPVVGVADPSGLSSDSLQTPAPCLARSRPTDTCTFAATSALGSVDGSSTQINTSRPNFSRPAAPTRSIGHTKKQNARLPTAPAAEPLMPQPAASKAAKKAELHPIASETTPKGRTISSLPGEKTSWTISDSPLNNAARSEQATISLGSPVLEIAPRSPPSSASDALSGLNAELGVEENLCQDIGGVDPDGAASVLSVSGTPTDLAVFRAANSAILLDNTVQPLSRNRLSSGPIASEQTSSNSVGPHTTAEGAGVSLGGAATSQACDTHLSNSNNPVPSSATDLNSRQETECNQLQAKPVHKYRYGELVVVLPPQPISMNSRSKDQRQSASSSELPDPLTAATANPLVVAHASTKIQHTSPTLMPALPLSISVAIPWTGSSVPFTPTPAYSFTFSTPRFDHTRRTSKHLTSPSSSHTNSSSTITLYAPIRRLRIGGFALHARRALADLKRKHAVTKTKLAGQSMRVLSSALVQLPITSTEPSVYAPVQSDPAVVPPAPAFAVGLPEVSDECDDMEESDDEEFMEYMLQMIEGAVPMEVDILPTAPEDLSRDDVPKPSSQEVATETVSEAEPSSSESNESTPPIQSTPEASPSPSVEPSAPIVNHSPPPTKLVVTVVETHHPTVPLSIEQTPLRAKRDRDEASAEPRATRRRVSSSFGDECVAGGAADPSKNSTLSACPNTTNSPSTTERPGSLPVSVSASASTVALTSVAELSAPSAEPPTATCEAAAIPDPANSKQLVQKQGVKRERDGISEIGEQVPVRRTRRRTAPVAAEATEKLTVNDKPVLIQQPVVPRLSTVIEIPEPEPVSTPSLTPLPSPRAASRESTSPAVISATQGILPLPAKLPESLSITRPYYARPTVSGLRLAPTAGRAGPSWTTPGNLGGVQQKDSRPTRASTTGGWTLGATHTMASSSPDANSSRVHTGQSPGPFVTGLGLKTGPTVIDRPSGYEAYRRAMGGNEE